jgi:predicted PhzF superfamily epimerase YddE/YHI9
VTPFYLVDVFTDRPFTGNPLAIVTDADGFDAARMQRIAAEFNQTETTFVLRPTVEGADWHLRSFTAVGTEVFGVGHNALGAWWWLAASGRLTLDAATRTFAQEIDSRVLPVEICSERGRVVSVGMTYVFCLDPLDPDSPARARFFGPNVGIAEDPATGSAAGPLAAYLVEHKLASERRPVIVEQGHTMGRPSRIEVRVTGGGVRVWGTAVLVLEGHLKH